MWPIQGGVAIIGGDGTSIQNNYVNVSADGSTLLGQTLDGIYIGGNFSLISQNIIRGIKRVGIQASDGNSSVGAIILNNQIEMITDTSPGKKSAIQLFQNDHTVRGNRLWVSSDGGAQSIGVQIEGSNEQIGGTNGLLAGSCAGDCNDISFFKKGIVVANSSTGNRILGNSIYSSGVLGIDLGDDGVSTNDFNDIDTGANRLQNYPNVVSVGTGNLTRVQGTLHSTASRTYRLEFFVNQSQSSSGFGEGRLFIGTTIVTTNSSGNSSFDKAFNYQVTSGNVSATATDLTTGDTSEFSPAILIQTSSIQFSAANYDVNENSAFATITATRTNGFVGAVSVQYATSNGTATAGQDYSTAVGTLNWTDGDTAAKTFNVPITDDTVFEGNEAVNLTLSNPTGGAIIGTPNAAVLTIIDNETQPTLTINNVIQNEGNSGLTPFTFTVTLSGPTTQTVTINYATSNGTAIAPGDYNAILPTQLTFSPGELTKPVTVLVTGDTNVEPDETFFVNMSGATNAGIANSQGTGTIKDDDTVILVSVSGRVTTPDGAGLKNAGVSLTDSQNVRRSVITNSFGVYSFANVAAGQTFTINVSSKRFRFASRSLLVNDNIANVDFVGIE